MGPMMDNGVEAGRLILVSGATGYVGGRLVPRLLAAGYRVRCLARDPSRLDGRGWRGAEIVAGDLLSAESLESALCGVTDAFYLVHSMSAGKSFEEKERVAATNFRDASTAARVKRIIYLGGLTRGQDSLSPHMRSRMETGEILRGGSASVTELRASVIVGSGSLSFELVRYLTERLPVMVTPKWVNTRCQPIGIRTVIEYLLAALEQPMSDGKIVEIGGPDVLSYFQMMTLYAQARGLKRLIIPVPVLTPRLSSYWLGLVTPIPTAISRELVESLRSDSVCIDPGAAKLFPSVKPMSFKESLELALARTKTHQVETTWTGALSSAPKDGPPPVKLQDEEGLISETRVRIIKAPQGKAFSIVASIGGENGWYYANFLWRLRSLMDRMIGGVGFRRGRRHPAELRVGDPLDFWRVEAWSPPNLMRLRAEMKVPGLAWLQFEVMPAGEGECVLTQKALFEPRGLFGLLYWYSLYPVHKVLFSGLVAEIARRAENQCPPG